MELSIRSQDKLALTKINSIGIEYDKKLVGYGNVCVKLGEYKTKERAIEVLDEIQNILKPKAILQAKALLSREAMKQIQEDYDMTVLPNCVDSIEPIPTSFVYDMPEE